MELEMEEMRNQMALLKNKLEKQDIVNDNLLRRSMRQKAGNINRRYLVISIICLAMIPYGYWAFVMLTGMSIAFWVATSLVMLTAFGYTLYNGRHMRDPNLFDDNLLNVRKKVALAKKLDHDWLKIGIPLCVLWLAYLGYEVYRVFDKQEATIMIAVCIIACLIGATIGLTIHFRTQQNYQDILDEIEDMTK